LIVPFALLLEIINQKNPSVKPVKSFPLNRNASLPRVSKRPANTNGRVMVVMYHHIREGGNAMYRSASKFRKDLERLYTMGFRPVTMTEMVNNKMSLAPGASPVVITFDDAHDNQFQIRKDGTIDPNCAVGIWKAFAERHPDFPVKGTWYVLPVLWGQKELRQKKIEMLESWGSEIGNHTVNHRDLRKLGEDAIKSELGNMNLKLASMGVPKDMPFCPPYGSYPRNKALLKSFKFKGQVIHHSSACLAGSCPSPSPENVKKFNRYEVPRVHGNGRGLGIDDWLNKIQTGEWKAYVAP
jgi:peptidoglycan/xylan/chitin deacetylase (PgdA/CDA1 family)